jgi:hypothetical protein
MVSLNKKVRASVFRPQGRSRRGGVLSFFAAGACAGAVLFFFYSF